jgi:hypothetical protein
MDNNLSESALRKVVIIRDSALFAGSDEHAQSAGHILSLIARLGCTALSRSCTSATSFAFCLLAARTLPRARAQVLGRNSQPHQRQSARQRGRCR